MMNAVILRSGKGVKSGKRELIVQLNDFMIPSSHNFKKGESPFFMVD